jgi:hypothetical protein
MPTPEVGGVVQLNQIARASSVNDSSSSWRDLRPTSGTVVLCGAQLRRRTKLFLASFLGGCSQLFHGGTDTEIFKIFACLQRRCKPSRFQPASRPRFRRVFWIAVFWGNWTP